MKYCIEIPEVYKVLVEVEAPKGTSREALIALVEEQFEGICLDEMEYSHTLENDEWTVRDEGKSIIE